MTAPEGHIQKDLWRAFAALDLVNLSESSAADLNVKHRYGVRARVAAPYAFPVGNYRQFSQMDFLMYLVSIVI